MPLRDHFHPPLSNRESWDGFHGGWPMMLVMALRKLLPPGFSARPKIHLGTGTAAIESDVMTFRLDAAPSQPTRAGPALLAPPEPTLAVNTELPTPDEYEVRVYDEQHERRLVAAIEIVSPSNKDRPEHRREFVGKCASLVRQGVSVSIIDLVTVRRANLYLDLLDFLGQSDPRFEARNAALYAVTCAGRSDGARWDLKTWAYPLTVGEPLPALPMILSDWLGVSLDLEPVYEETCQVLDMV